MTEKRAHTQSERSEGRQGDREEGQGRRVFFRRRKSCPFVGENAPKITHLDTKLLQKYISERGKIIPRRITGVGPKPQRDLSMAIKRARFLALLPYAVK